MAYYTSRRHITKSYLELKSEKLRPHLHLKLIDIVSNTTCENRFLKMRCVYYNDVENEFQRGSDFRVHHLNLSINDGQM
ncbi:hypothetical protein PGB90_007171 [Kerria lacca]